MASMNGLRSCSKTRLRPYLVPTCPSFLARLSARQARDDALARAMCSSRAARSAESTAARGPSPVVATGNGLYAAPALRLVRGGWRPDAAFGGVRSAERYWRRDRASLGRVCRPSARGCAHRDSARSLHPFAARGRRPRVRGGWRPGALRRHLVGSACGAESYSSALGPDPSAELCNAGIQTQED